MQQIIYASTALKDLEFTQIQEILTVANKKNKEFNLSGVLLYDGVYFLQVLEGKPDDIESLMNNLKKDKKHSKIILLGSKEIYKRDFQEWSMGFVNAAKELKEVIKEESKHSIFNPYEFEYDEAIRIMKRLVYLV